MTPRDRVLTALDHRAPDRIPIDFWADAEVFTRLQQALGLDSKEQVLARFGVDLRYFNGPSKRPTASDAAPHGPDITMDHWGVLRQVQTVSGKRRDGTTYQWTYKHLHRSPLAQASTVQEIEAHAWPSAEALWDYSNVKAACQAIRQAGYASVAGADRLDRTAQLKPAMYLRGTEPFMMDLVAEPAMAECLLEHIAQYYLDYNRRVFEAAGGTIDIFFMGDDMGTQASTWVSAPMYRRFFKKRLAAYCELAHSYGIKTMYHTCGNVVPLIPEFIEAGLDILQSLQPAAMGEQLRDLKRQFGKDLCFQGGIDIQHVLPQGTPQDVARHVCERAQLLGEGGGYIFGTAHNILPDTPTENVLALVEAYQKYGRLSG